MELSKVSKINSLLNYDVDPREFLDEDEYEYLRQRKQINHVHDYFFAPSHKRKLKTYRIQKFCSDDMNIAEFISKIISFLEMDFFIAIESFLGFFFHLPQCAKKILNKFSKATKKTFAW